MREQRQVRVNSELSKYIEVKVEITKSMCCRHFSPEVVVYVVIEMAKDGVLSDLLYTDYLILMSETIHGIGTDRHHCFKSGNIPKTEGGQIYLINVTALKSQS